MLVESLLGYVSNFTKHRGRQKSAICMAKTKCSFLFAVAVQMWGTPLFLYFSLSSTAPFSCECMRQASHGWRTDQNKPEEGFVIIPSNFACKHFLISYKLVNHFLFFVVLGDYLNKLLGKYIYLSPRILKKIQIKL
jgi:hypothetical protein